MMQAHTANNTPAPLPTIINPKNAPQVKTSPTTNFAGQVLADMSIATAKTAATKAPTATLAKPSDIKSLWDKISTYWQPTTKISVSANLNSTQTIPSRPLNQLSVITPWYSPSEPAYNMASGAVTPNYTTPMTVFDSKGDAHTIVTSYVKTAANEWAVEVYPVPASDINSFLQGGQIAFGTVAFNGDGTLKSISPSLSNAKIHWTNGAKESTIQFNWGTPGKADGLSQYAGNYLLNSLSQNGAPPGKLTGISFNAKHQLVASYDNGLTRVLDDVIKTHGHQEHHHARQQDHEHVNMFELLFGHQGV